MSQNATQIPFENQIYTAVVKAQNKEFFTLVHELGIVQAKKASSCLLMPEVGDMVAFLHTTQSCYILHILEREEQPAKLLLPTNTIITHENSLHIKQGETHTSLAFQTDSYSLSAKENININSKEIKEVAQKISLTSTHTILAGNTLTTRFQNIRTFCDHAVKKIKNAFAFFDKKTEKIENLLDIDAKQTQINVKENLRVRSKHSSIKAKEVMTIDAEHINIG